jgi:hypothetical protein
MGCNEPEKLGANFIFAAAADTLAGCDRYREQNMQRLLQQGPLQEGQK